MNKVICTGNLTKDPEKVDTANGKTLCKMILAVQNDFKNADGEYDAQFINVVCWGGLADNCCKYLTKGNKILVDGKLNLRNYQAEDGTKKYVTEIVAQDVEFLKTKQN